VTITPNGAWGGEGSLGCGIGYGYLHRIPVDGKIPDQLPPSPTRTKGSTHPFHQDDDRPKLKEGSVLSIVPEFVAPQPECLTPELLPTSLISQVWDFLEFTL
jgi:hypothetical protein